jgi:hypothetical protein
VSFSWVDPNFSVQYLQREEIRATLRLARLLREAGRQAQVHVPDEAALARARTTTSLPWHSTLRVL